MSSGNNSRSNSKLVALICATLATLCALMLALGCQTAGAMSADGGDGRAPAATLAVVENPEITARVLESLLRSVVYSATASEMQPFTNGAQKRGLDLGISRGFSGSQAGKHLMGLSAASFANGPGKR